MTELQQAAQQALKILDSEFTTLNGEFCRWCDGRLNAKHNCALEQTITALKSALAEPTGKEFLQVHFLTDEQISDLWHQSGEQPFKFARMLLK